MPEGLFQALSQNGLAISGVIVTGLCLPVLANIVNIILTRRLASRTKRSHEEESKKLDALDERIGKLHEGVVDPLADARARIAALEDHLRERDGSPASPQTPPAPDPGNVE